MLALSVHEKSQCSCKIMFYIDCLVQSEKILNCRRMKMGKNNASSSGKKNSNDLGFSIYVLDELRCAN